MAADKTCLFVALYAFGGTLSEPAGEEKYHWALLLGPPTADQNSRGIRYHAKNRWLSTGTTEWYFAEEEVPMAATHMLLVRVLVGVVQRTELLSAIARSVPVHQGDPNWTCQSWTKDALDAVRVNGEALEAELGAWEDVQCAALVFVARKRAEHRFDGVGRFDMRWPATFDLIEGKETIA